MTTFSYSYSMSSFYIYMYTHVHVYNIDSTLWKAIMGLALPAIKIGDLLYIIYIFQLISKLLLCIST